ncbi:MAG: hypothetical protein JWR03_517 [Cohnella sp.]|nr:hypothetical protein [Cohnella sp.]
MQENTSLRKNSLSIIEVLALSMAIIGPTIVMAFNTSLMAGAAGANAPLAFLVSTIAMLFVGITFMEFSKRISHAGSVYAYNAHGLGAKTGFISGWCMALTYFCFTAGCCALFGNFADIFLKHFGINIPIPILVLICLLIVWFLSYRDVRLSTRAALLLELTSMVVVLILAFVIVGKGGASGNSAAPFTISAGSVSGIGMALIFGVFSYAGFEGAATLAEEAKNPRRAVPVAIVGNLLLLGAFFVFVIYAQVIGFGVEHMDKLASSASPLDTLATTYVGQAMAIFVDFAAAISALACALGAAGACSRMLFAMGRDGVIPRVLGKTHPTHRTPHVAVHTIAILVVVLYAVWGIGSGASNFYGYVGTIGTFTILVTYMLINIAAIRYFRRNRAQGYSVFKHMIVPILGFLILLWPLYNNLYPIPPFPFNVFPYVAAAWIIVGVVVINLKTRRDPTLANRLIADMEELGA